MKNQNITKALTEGLLAGYGGKTTFSKVTRGTFELSSSHFEKDDVVYHDEWTNNGGQEIVSAGNKVFTRVYAGGVINSKVLTSLKITSSDVITQLISRINELKDKTRLFDDCTPSDHGSWGYKYQIIDRDNQLSITTGKESVLYQGQIVFVHVFVLSAVE